MKSYLDLVPISAKIRRRQNRITILCIVISVLLVTTVFSIADMLIQTQTNRMADKHGNWHYSITAAPSDETTVSDIIESLRHDSAVRAIGQAESFNLDFDQPYYIEETKAALLGADSTYMTEIKNGLSEGHFPANSNEILLTDNAKAIMDVQIGDAVYLHTPAGDFVFLVSGFGSDDERYYSGQFYGIGVTMTPEMFTTVMMQNEITEQTPTYYIQFENATKAASKITELKEQYPLSDDIFSENLAAMAMAGKSNNESMKNLYSIAAFLFVLVLLAGVLMISGSMNSNVAQRTQFFGMLRCIGASQKQIIWLVRLEALGWCKAAVPAGIMLGTCINWAICAVLHYGIGGEFSTTPVFQFSLVGVICGILVGMVTVLLAAQSPAKRAAKIPPMTAVSGHGSHVSTAPSAFKHCFWKIQWTLGIHHATASKKNWTLMTASFALSIILFLCFSVGMNLAHALLPNLRSWQPDVSFNGYTNAAVLERSLTDELSKIPGVAYVWGSSYKEHIPVISSNPSVDHINLVSYDDFMIANAKQSIAQGDLSAVLASPDNVMTIFSKDNPIQVGDRIQLGDKELEVVCALSDGLFSSDATIICPQAAFDNLVGEQNYTIVGVQLDNETSDSIVAELSSFADEDVIFSDLRQSNRENTSTYYATRIIGYGFFMIISMITVFNIINSISMSVSARIRQYGAMRAVGMTDRQLTEMIAAETFTYAISGLLLGFGIGVPLSRYLYTLLITDHFGIAWSLPMTLLMIITLFVFASAVIAVRIPVKRIRSMAITETINEL